MSSQNELPVYIKDLSIESIENSSIYGNISEVEILPKFDKELNEEE